MVVTAKIFKYIFNKASLGLNWYIACCNICILHLLYFSSTEWWMGYKKQLCLYLQHKTKVNKKNTSRWSCKTCLQTALTCYCKVGFLLCIPINSLRQILNPYKIHPVLPRRCSSMCLSGVDSHTYMHSNIRCLHADHSMSHPIIIMIIY